MKKHFFSPCWAFLWCFLTLLWGNIHAMEYLPPQKMPLYYDSQDVTLSESHIQIQDLFCQHTLRHADIIHPNAKGDREKFQGELETFVQELYYWQTKDLLLSSHHHPHGKDLLDSLKLLPHHYNFLVILAKAKKESDFEMYLSHLEMKWRKGSHLDYRSPPLNIFEQQMRALYTLKKNIWGLSIDYKSKLNQCSTEKKAKPVLNSLLSVCDFIGFYQNFIERLVIERLDFISLCHVIYPPLYESMNDVISSLRHLYFTYKPMIPAPNYFPPSQETIQPKSRKFNVPPLALGTEKSSSAPTISAKRTKESLHKKSGSPKVEIESPTKKADSPKKKIDSPKKEVDSPHRKTDSPKSVSLLLPESESGEGTTNVISKISPRALALIKK